MKNQSIMVSVIVTVYNHEKYLEECLDSILRQKTNFKYEVLVHDDCSTDNSKAIMEKYYQKYPDIIVPLYEKENQYTKGTRIIIDIIMPRMRGKYFCFCEGDDYWLDENKLQRQFDFLEQNSDYKFCVHNSIYVNRNSKKLREHIVSQEDSNLTCEDFILGGGGFVFTNSIFSCSSLVKELPKYFEILSLDYLWQIYLSSCGKTRCFKDFMSAYRVQSEGSWSERVKKDPDSYVRLMKRIVSSLEIFDQETNKQYTNVVKKAIVQKEYDILLAQRNYKRMRQEPYKAIWKKQSFKTKVKYFLSEYFPKIYDKIQQIRSKK